MRRIFPAALAVVLMGSLGLAAKVQAQTVQGTANLGIEQPVTKVEGKEVVTTIKVKNMSKGAIAGLRVEEYWYDKDGNPIPGGSKRLSKPLAAGAVQTIELRTPKVAGMYSNNLVFSHDNGKIQTTVYAKVE